MIPARDARVPPAPLRPARYSRAPDRQGFEGEVAVRRSALAGVILLLSAVPALAQQAPRPAPTTRPATPATPAPATPPQGSPASAEPERTTATFGDWVMRCERPASGAQRCEAAQVVSANNQPIAQFALGYPVPGEALRLTILLPHNVGLGAAPRLVAPEGGPPPVELSWRRCLPAGCFAEATPGDAIGALRARAEPMRLLYQDAAGREVALPFSPRGLAPALDALPR